MLSTEDLTEIIIAVTGLVAAVAGLVSAFRSVHGRIDQNVYDIRQLQEEKDSSSPKVLLPPNH